MVKLSLITKTSTVMWNFAFLLIKNFQIALSVTLELHKEKIYHYYCSLYMCEWSSAKKNILYYVSIENEWVGDMLKILVSIKICRWYRHISWEWYRFMWKQWKPIVINGSWISVVKTLEWLYFQWSRRNFNLINISVYGRCYDEL